jgi:hypothetical protein
MENQIQMKMKKRKRMMMMMRRMKKRNRIRLVSVLDHCGQLESIKLDLAHFNKVIAMEHFLK